MGAKGVQCAARERVLGLFVPVVKFQIVDTARPVNVIHARSCSFSVQLQYDQAFAFHFETPSSIRITECG